MAGNIIQQATFRAALDPGGYEQGGDRMIRKSAEITNAVDRVSDSTTKAGRNAALSSQGFDKLLASLDPNIQRAQQYQREFDKLNRYHEAGVRHCGAILDSIAIAAKQIFRPEQRCEEAF
jgi:hypothetical protein